MDINNKNIVQEAQVLRGMISEIRSKLILLRNKLLEEKQEKASLGQKLEISSDLNQKIIQSISIYKKDLSKYTYRLKNIYKDLETSNEFNFFPRLDFD